MVRANETADDRRGDVHACKPRERATERSLSDDRPRARAILRARAPRSRTRPPFRTLAAADLPPRATEHLLPALLASRPLSSSPDEQSVRLPGPHLPHGPPSPAPVHGHRRRRPPREDEPAALAPLPLRPGGGEAPRGGGGEGRARGQGRTVRLQLHHPGHAVHGAPLRPPALLRQEETDGGSAVGQGDGDFVRPRGEGRGRAQDHGAHPVGPGRARVGSQPDALSLRPGRGSHHARARHARAALLPPPRGGQVRRRRARATLQGGSE